MITRNATRAAVMAAAAVGFAAAAAQADECEAMTKSVKVLIDKSDPAAKGGDNPAALRRGSWTHQVVPRGRRRMSRRRRQPHADPLGPRSLDPAIADASR
jgi:hypothetical protein